MAWLTAILATAAKAFGIASQYISFRKIPEVRSHYHRRRNIKYYSDGSSRDVTVYYELDEIKIAGVVYFELNAPGGYFVAIKSTGEVRYILDVQNIRGIRTMKCATT